MNKRQGFALGTILAAGLLLRPVGSTVQPQAGPPRGDGSPASLSGLPSAEGDGPWVASCNYWAPMREPEWSKDDSDVNSAIHAEGGGVDLHLQVQKASQARNLGCQNQSTDRWGLPTDLESLDITAIIATVPDPVHAHVAMSFDRAVDALLQAAQDNGYVGSYYWLPWKNSQGPTMADSDGNTEPGHDPVREREPGLMVLRNLTAKKVIYVFLVGETPTLGIDGFQFERAFAYETELKSAVNGHGLFSRGRSGSAAIIGPQYSGSAASLKLGIETAQRKFGITEFEAAGTTSTALPVSLLTSKELGEAPDVSYYSFAEDRDYDRSLLKQRLSAAGFDPGRTTLLVEDDTGYSVAVINNDYKVQLGLREIHFPRNVSLLRNAQAIEDQYGTEAIGSTGVHSPYLRLSLKEPSPEDSVPDFSREHTPNSQEAQLMAIARELHRNRSQFVGIIASNVLDQVFLAQFLHRACPDARLLFLGSDLLMVRDVDNVPFIGSVTITPYPLMTLGTGGSRAYPSSANEAYYNAAAYTLWNKRAWGATATNPRVPLQGYTSPVRWQPLPRQPQQEPFHPALWATAIGSDGYYPLAVLSPCASTNSNILPAIASGGKPRDGWKLPGGACTQEPRLPSKVGPTTTIYPARLWSVLWVLVSLLCITHCVTLIVADYWSPFTRDLSLDGNDQPRRRSMGVHVAAAMLFSMAFIVAFPVLSLNGIVGLSKASIIESVVTIGLGFVAVLATFCRTWGHIRPPRFDDSDEFRSFLFMVGAWTALVGVPLIWRHLCLTNSVRGSTPQSSIYLVGASFAYRCINPSSGVSPVVPVLLLLFGWYLWAFFQTRRLRFSDCARPHLPKKLPNKDDGRFFVTDNDLSRDALSSCTGPYCCYLYESITCLLFGRHLVRRLWFSRATNGSPPDVQCAPEATTKDRKRYRYLGIDLALALGFAALLVWFAFFSPVHSLDHFVWNTGRYRSNPYELLVGALFCPLIVVCLANWLRMVFVWAELKRGVLERLENLPIRFAFNRLKVMGWVTMLSQAGLREQWRDMARSREAMRQMLHEQDLEDSIPEAEWQNLKRVKATLDKEISGLFGDQLIRPQAPEGSATAPTDLTERPVPEPTITATKVVEASTFPAEHSLPSAHTLSAEAAEPSPALLTRSSFEPQTLAEAKSSDSGREPLTAIGSQPAPAPDCDTKRPPYEHMRSIEDLFAKFAQVLLSSVLIPNWRDTRTGLVESEEVEELPVKARRSPSEVEHPYIPMELRAGPSSTEPDYILVAEEFVAIRYMSLIRAVLANMRYLMLFVSFSFALAIMAWNSYPFQPRQQVDWIFTGILVLLGSGMIWVFAQMHRDPILSRITDTKANELGWDFYMRIISFGALPVFTWLAYQFPDVGNFIAKFIQPTIPVVQ